MVAIGQILNEVASATADYSGPVASKEFCALLPIRGSLSASSNSSRATASSSVWSSWLTVEHGSGTTGTRKNTSHFSAFHSVFWHAAELALLIPAKIWTVKFVKIQWTLHSKKEGKGDNTVSFFFFCLSRPHTLCGIHMHCINDDLPLHSAHKQQQNWNSTNWRATHCDFSSKYAVADFTCFRKLFKSTFSKQVWCPFTARRLKKVWLDTTERKFFATAFSIQIDKTFVK